MRRPYQELEKPLAHRTVELVQGLELVADSLQRIAEGETRYLIVLSGQLRSLLTERSKGESPLLFEMSKKLGKELEIHCMPGVSEPSHVPAALLGKDLILSIAGMPVTLERTLHTQKKIKLAEFLNRDLILFHDTPYSAKSVIEWYANKAGGSHYSRNVPEDFATLTSLNLGGIQPIANLLLQIGTATLASGRQLLKGLVDLEIYALVVIPAQEPEAVQEVNYLFDSQYTGSAMRLSITLDASMVPSFYVCGLQGIWVRVGCDRIVDWSEPRIIHATLSIEDDLCTKVELAIDGVRVGRAIIKTPLFVLSNPLDYDSCHNKSLDGEPQKFVFGESQFYMFGRELDLVSRSKIAVDLADKRTDPDLRVMVFSPGAFARCAPGQRDLAMTGSPNFKLARDVEKFSAPDV